MKQLTKTKLKEIIREELLIEGGVSGAVFDLRDKWDETLELIATSGLNMDDKKYERMINNASKLFEKAISILEKIK